jgi:hypothetical protein
MQINQTQGVKPEIRECELRRVLHWQGKLKQKGVQQVLGVY